VNCLVGIGFVKCFHYMRSMKVQLRLFECALVDWLSHVFCIMRIMFKKAVIPEDQYCSLSSVHGIKRKTCCIVRKSEKTSTNFRWLLNEYRYNCSYIVYISKDVFDFR
jgi:hypothetical protein